MFAKMKPQADGKGCGRGSEQDARMGIGGRVAGWNGGVGGRAKRGRKSFT